MPSLDYSTISTWSNLKIFNEWIKPFGGHAALSTWLSCTGTDCILHTFIYKWALCPLPSTGTDWILHSFTWVSLMTGFTCIPRVNFSWAYDSVLQVQTCEGPYRSTRAYAFLQTSVSVWGVKIACDIVCAHFTCLYVSTFRDRYRSRATLSLI